MIERLDLTLFTPVARQHLKEWLQSRLDVQRARNDTVHDDERTDHIRGRIAELKAFILAMDPPQPPPRKPIEKRDKVTGF